MKHEDPTRASTLSTNERTEAAQLTNQRPGLVAEFLIYHVTKEYYGDNLLTPGHNRSLGFIDSIYVKASCQDGARLASVVISSHPLLIGPV